MRADARSGGDGHRPAGVPGCRSGAAGVPGHGPAAAPGRPPRCRTAAPGPAGRDPRRRLRRRQQYPVGRTGAGLLGHNVIEHDLPILKQQAPALALHSLPVIDTLRLSPLAFPQNPYHRLVKDYKLIRDSLNSPLADCRSTLTLFRDQRDAFAQLSPSVCTFHPPSSSTTCLNSRPFAECTVPRYRPLLVCCRISRA